MAKKSVWKTLAGLAVLGAAVGGAVAYVKKCKEVNDLSEEDFDDLMNDTEETCDACQPERTYTTLHTDSDGVKISAPATETPETSSEEEVDAEEAATEDAAEEDNVAKEAVETEAVSEEDTLAKDL